MTSFEQFIVIYILSTTALAGAAVLWRNWLADHPSWKLWLQNHLGVAAQAFTCGSCFTYWIALVFVFILNPLGPFIIRAFPFAAPLWSISYAIQWMSLSWIALVLRFGYIFLQESVNKLVHGPDGHGH